MLSRKHEPKSWFAVDFDRKKPALPLHIQSRWGWPALTLSGCRGAIVGSLIARTLVSKIWSECGGWSALHRRHRTSDSAPIPHSSGTQRWGARSINAAIIMSLQGRWHRTRQKFGKVSLSAYPVIGLLPPEALVAFLDTDRRSQTGPLLLIEISYEQVTFNWKAGKSDADHGNPYELFTWKVDTFGKNSSQHRQSDRAGSVGEFSQEWFALWFGHASSPSKRWDSQRGKLLMKLVQVREGRAVDEIVAGIFTKMSSNGLDDWVHRSVPLLKRDVEGCDAYRQLIGSKRRRVAAFGRFSWSTVRK
jgi:hypothetical protein